MAKVIFKRIESSSNINNVPIADGQIIFTKDGNEYIDYGNERIQVIQNEVITIDDQISEVSTNPVQNNKVKEYVDDTAEALQSEIDGLSLGKYILATTSVSTSNVTKIQLDTIASSEGNFTLSNGSIVIPSGVNKIRVSACTYIDVLQNGYFWGYISKNDVNVAQSINSFNGVSYGGCVIPPTIVSVSAGDTISFGATNTCAGKNATGAENLWVLVEKVS